MDPLVITAGAFTVRLSWSEFEPPAFDAMSVGVNTPADVGVPLMTPVDGAKESPAGKAPLVTLQVIGAVPVADIVRAYTDPVTAAGKGDEVTMDGGVGGALTIRLNCSEFEPAALVDVTVKV